MNYRLHSAVVAVAAMAFAVNAETPAATAPAKPTTAAPASPAATPPTIVGKPEQAFSKISLVRVVDKLQDGAVWASAHGGWFCLANGKTTWSSGSQDDKPSVYQGVFRDAMNGAGLSVVGGDTENLFDHQTDLGDLQVAAVITDIYLDYCMPKVGYRDLSTIHGQITMGIEWQVYAPLKRMVVAKVTTHGGYETKDNVAGGIAWMLKQAFADNAKKAAQDPEFRAALAVPKEVMAGEMVRPDSQAPIVLVGSAGAKTRPVSDSVGSVVMIFTGSGHGSGFLVSGDGLVLTDEHVVGGDKFVKVRWPDGIENVGEVIRTSKARDVAIIKTDPRGRLPLPLRRSPLQVGDTVFAIGAPENEKFQSTVTRGVVSANRTLQGLAYIQSDVNIGHGSSGGPLLDDRGDVVGLADIGVRAGDGMEGLNLFTPVGDALDFLGGQAK